MDDEAVRLGAILLLVVAAAALYVGGRQTPVAGTWLDGVRAVRLRQLGCYLRGSAEVAGGRQAFVGLALFGRVVLWRTDFGTRHLQHLGFEAAQTERLQGQVTGLFRFRWRPSAAKTLEGTFSGKRFAFAGARLESATFVLPAPRTWQKDG